MSEYSKTVKFSDDQEIANRMTYEARYNNYKLYQAAKNYTWAWTFEQWKKYSASSTLPASCRAGQGKMEWQK